MNPFLPEPLPLLPHDPRYCRTHAFAASLFAAHPWHHSNAATWVFVAQAWSDLADMKERSLNMPVRKTDGGE